MKSLNNKILLLTLLSLLVSCKKNNKNNLDINAEARVTEYYPDGKVKKIYHVKNQQWNGLAKFYSNSGQLESVETYINSKKHGWSFYYKNGNIYQKVFFKDNLRYGPYSEYYVNHRGKIHYKVNYLIVRDKSEATDFVEYSPEGKIIKQSNKVIVKLSQDTITIGDSIKAELELINPEFNNMRAFVGGFDEHFYIKDSLKMKVLEGKNFKVSFTFTPDSSGWQALRGYVSDYKIIKRHKNGSYETKSKHIYFERKYYVKEFTASVAGLPHWRGLVASAFTTLPGRSL